MAISTPTKCDLRVNGSSDQNPLFGPSIHKGHFLAALPRQNGLPKALQGYSAVGHCKALKGHLVEGHCRDILRLGAAGILCGWVRQEYVAIEHCSQAPGGGRGQHRP